MVTGSVGAVMRVAMAAGDKKRLAASESVSWAFATGCGGRADGVVEIRGASRKIGLFSAFIPEGIGQSATSERK